MKRNYDTLAPFYDQLAHLVYGRGQINAQLFLLKAIPAGSAVLIVGGGTGWVLEDLAKIHPSGLSITYIDSSAKMIALAENRHAGNNKVAFINAPVESVVTTDKYDVILTPFLFDNFSESALQAIFPEMHKQLKAGGLWLYCDFRKTVVLWQRALLKTMYVFFRWACNIDADHMPDVAACFARYGYKTAEQKTFLRGFVTAEVHVKSF